MKKLLVLAFVLIVIGIHGNAGANLIVNGGFEGSHYMIVVHFNPEANRRFRVFLKVYKQKYF